MFCCPGGGSRNIIGKQRVRHAHYNKLAEGLLFSFQRLLPRKYWSRNSPFAFVILHISLTCVYRFDGKLLLLILFLIMQSKFMGYIPQRVTKGNEYVFPVLSIPLFRFPSGAIICLWHLLLLRLCRQSLCSTMAVAGKHFFEHWKLINFHDG